MSTLLRVEDIHKRYGQEDVLKGVSFEMQKGDTKVIIGPSGTGKSTLLRCINRLTPADRGVEDRQMAVEQYRRGTLKAADFVQTVSAVADAPAACAALRDDKNNNFSLVFDWERSS